ncbi:unnamed protein product [Symbiodinium sp. CCMP2592]|nr:unnamed protein product [Symbiodinium sp. CCMP2592]
MSARTNRKFDAEEGPAPALLAVRAAVGGLCGQKHSAECPAKRNCPRCKWIANQSAWKKKFPWLDAKFRIQDNSSCWGLGCRQCAEVQQSQPELFHGLMVSRHHFARYEVQHGELKLQRFQKHADSPAHQIAARAFSMHMDQDDGKEPKNDASSPSFPEWKQVLHEPKLTAVGAVAATGKCRMMRWCIATAHRRSLKDKMRNALCISIQSDMRGNRADGLREAIMPCITSFCSKEVPPNYGGLRVKSPEGEQQVDKDFLVMLCSRIEGFAADSAYDEQLAARELQGGPLAGPAIPPLQEHLTQLLSRPWAAESFLKSCVVEILEKQNSIAKLITHRPAIKQLYEDFRKKLPDAPCGSDLRYAPQRYSSESVTLLRVVVSFESILGTLSCVPDVRGCSSEEGAACLHTLQWLDTEKCMQLGMLGDAALEVQRLVEIADRDEEDIIEFPFYLEHFRQVLGKLFVEGMCLQILCLTTVMLEHLKLKRTFVLQQGRAMSLGGDITEDLKARCLRRMATYVALADKVLVAEFPSYDIMACFKVFSVQDAVRSKQLLQNVRPDAPWVRGPNRHPPAATSEWWGWWDWDSDWSSQWDWRTSQHEEASSSQAPEGAKGSGAAEAPARRRPLIGERTEAPNQNRGRTAKPEKGKGKTGPSAGRPASESGSRTPRRGEKGAGKPTKGKPAKGAAQPAKGKAAQAKGAEQLAKGKPAPAGKSGKGKPATQEPEQGSGKKKNHRGGRSQAARANREARGAERREREGTDPVVLVEGPGTDIPEPRTPEETPAGAGQVIQSPSSESSLDTAAVPKAPVFTGPAPGEDTPDFGGSNSEGERETPPAAAAASSSSDSSGVVPAKKEEPAERVAPPASAEAAAEPAEEAKPKASPKAEAKEESSGSPSSEAGQEQAAPPPHLGPPPPLKEEPKAAQPGPAEPEAAVPPAPREEAPEQELEPTSPAEDGEEEGEESEESSEGQGPCQFLNGLRHAARNRPETPWEGNPRLAQQYGEALTLLDEISQAIFALRGEVANLRGLLESQAQQLQAAIGELAAQRQQGLAAAAATVAAATAAPAPAPTQASGGGHLLKSMRLPTSLKGRDDWERFAFQAESYLAVVDTRYPAELEIARKCKAPLQMSVMTEEVRTLSVRLFGMLGSWTQDSATAVKLARGVKGQNGFELWRLLWQEHNPENESKNLTWRRTLLMPKFPPKESDFSLALQEWEADLDRYASEYGAGRALADEDLRAVLVTESPTALRQHLAMHAASLSTYAEVREVVVSYLQAKRVWTPSAGYAASSRRDPNAMDIGRIGDRDGKDGKGKGDKGKKGDKDHKKGKGDHNNRGKGKGDKKGNQQGDRDGKERCPICWKTGHTVKECWFNAKGKGKGTKGQVAQVADDAATTVSTASLAIAGPSASQAGGSTGGSGGKGQVRQVRDDRILGVRFAPPYDTEPEEDKILKVSGSLLVDSGACVSVCRPEAFPDLQPAGPPKSLYSVDNSRLKTKGQVQPSLLLGEERQSCKVNFEVTEDIEDSHILWPDGVRASILKRGSQFLLPYERELPPGSTNRVAPVAPEPPSPGRDLGHYDYISEHDLEAREVEDAAMEAAADEEAEAAEEEEAAGNPAPLEEQAEQPDSRPRGLLGGLAKSRLAVMSVLSPDLIAQVDSMLDQAAEGDRLVRTVQDLLQLLKQNNLVTSMRLSPMHVGVHPKNRDGAGIIAGDCLELLENVLSVGFVRDRITALAVEITDASVRRFNEDLVRGSGGQLGELDGDMLKVVSLAGSHTNFMLRLLSQGAALSTSAASVDGRLSLEKVARRDPELANAAREGLVWDVISREVATRWPQFLGLVQSAMNATLQKQESEMQLLHRVHRLVSAVEKVDFSSIKKQALASKPPCSAKTADSLLSQIREKMNSAGLDPLNSPDALHILGMTEVNIAAKILGVVQPQEKRYKSLHGIAHDCMVLLSKISTQALENPWADKAEETPSGSGDATTAQPSTVAMRELLDDGTYGNPDEVMREAGFEVGCTIKRKNDKDEYIIRGVKKTYVRVENQSTVVIVKASLESFMSKEWTKVVAKPQPSVIADLTPFNPDESLDWQAHVFVGALLQELQGLWKTFGSSSLQGKLSLQLKPSKALTATAAFPKRKLVLVPVTSKIIFKNPDDTSGMPSGTPLQTTWKKDGRLFFAVSSNQLPREEGGHGFLAPYFAVPTTPDEEQASLEEFMHKAPLAKWPLLRNKAAISIGDSLLIYKPVSKAAAEDLEEASPLAAKRRRLKMG